MTTPQKTQTAEERLVENIKLYYANWPYSPRPLAKHILSDKEAIKQLAREMPVEDFMEIVKERVEVDKEKLADFIPDEYCDVGLGATQVKAIVPYYDDFQMHQLMIENGDELVKTIAEAQDKILRVKG